MIGGGGDGSLIIWYLATTSLSCYYFIGIQSLDHMPVVVSLCFVCLWSV
jgi:hypothetical protein